MEASLYLHIPFCAGACDYCDFYSIPVEPETAMIPRYVDALLRDAEQLIRDFEITSIPTVYIGGGTPSLLGAAEIGRLLSALEGLQDSPPTEITVEANPESADEAFLQTCLEKGVTRLSLGIQSFHLPSREAVHRTGTASDAELGPGYTLFRGRFSADIMTGLPFQNETILLNDIARLLARAPGHISLYALTVEPGTPLAERVRLNPTLLPEQDAADALWIAGRDALEYAGYAQYEVSNFALPGKQSAHNIRYWRMENWLGLGSSASSTIIDDETGEGVRLTFAPDAPAYISGTAPAAETLDRLTLVKETLLMGFRYIGGPDETLFRKRFGLDVEECIPQTLAAWRKKGLLNPEKPALAKTGLLFLDPFLLDAFAEAETRRGIF
ncbi:MAG: radical SAM family heme chaperone HemW [Spirochaetaceae bacterium]|jgi:oxygen-independent coproporphyrinogen-3 oxidase|nr:radical SAM family heme chaperone HemW [Spirochaetaceae bacterium]